MELHGLHMIPQQPDIPAEHRGVVESEAVMSRAVYVYTHQVNSAV
jgi:hypothetical protein